MRQMVPIGKEIGMEDGKELFTRGQAAEVLQVGVHTVDRMIQRGELNAVRFGGLVRIPRWSLERYTKRGEVDA